METLIWTDPGLGQYYKRLDSGEDPTWVQGGELPAESDREHCQREDTGLPCGKPYHGRIHIWITRCGIRPYGHLAQYRGLTGELGELTPVLGLASDCSTQSDCRGCLEKLHQGSPSRELNWRRKRHSYPRVKGNGAACVTLASSSRPLPVIQHTERN